MITNIWLYSFIPLLATLFCSVVLVKSYISNAASVYQRLFANLVVLNALQAIAYILFSLSQAFAEYVADAYLISVYYLFVHLPLLAFYLINEVEPKWTKYLYVFPVTLTIFHLFGFMVESYRVEHNALMHNDGKLSIVFDVFVMLSSIVTVSVLFFNAKRLKNKPHVSKLLESRNIIALISFIPLTFVFFIIIILSMTAYAIPVVIIVPLISFYIASIFFYVSKSRIVDLTIGSNAFWERVKLALLLLESLKTKQDLDAFNQRLRLQRYREAMVANANDFNAAADELNVHHTTLRNTLKNT